MAALFWTLLVADRTGLYLSSRIAWLVPMGAALLTIVAVGRLMTSRTERPEQLSARGWWGYAIVVLPVILVLALPPITLGSFSAARRSAFSASGLITPDDIDHGPLTLIHVGAAQSNPEDMVRLRRRAGEEVTFVGIVRRDVDMPPDELVLTRFVITCCVADATSAYVRVVDVPSGAFEDGSWVEVTGRMYPIGNEVLVAATAAHAIPQPADPYLYAA